MGRIMAFDYGVKRTGVAVTDPLQIVANSLTTINTSEIFSFLKQYLKNETIETFVVGIPKRLNTSDTHATKAVESFITRLTREFPYIPVVRIDERFTTEMAFKTLLQSGIGKKKRSDKMLINKISATIILQSYLEQKSNKLP